jgi:hypothetical protein
VYCLNIAELDRRMGRESERGAPVVPEVYMMVAIVSGLGGVGSAGFASPSATKSSQ